MNDWRNNAYIRLMRFDRPVGITLLMFPCWWGACAASYSSSGAIPWHVLAWTVLGACAMRAAGCVINDMTDCDVDLHVARTASRPLASGVIGMRQAGIVLAGLLCIGGIVALALGWPVVLLSVCWLPLIAAYPWMKRITFWPQAFLGLTFGAGPLFGALAVLGYVPIAIIIMYCGSALWTVGYDTIYAYQDREDDARIGVKSTALLFGRHGRIGVAICYALAVICWLVSALMLSANAAVLLSIAGMALLLIWQLWQFDMKNGQSCAALFASNGWVGAVGVLGYAAAIV